MGAFQLISLTASKAGKEAAFKAWYADVHIPEVLTVPGISSGRAAQLGDRMGYVPWQQIAIFEIEADDPDSIIPEIQRRIKTGEMSLHDSVEMTAVSLFII